MKDRQTGFSLIELLMVVAIILIIAAIAIPNFLRAKITANESSAVSSVHAVNTAEIAYSTMFTSIGYSAALSDLGTGGTSPCPSHSYSFLLYRPGVGQWHKVWIHIHICPERFHNACGPIHAQCGTPSAGYYRPEEFLFRREQCNPVQLNWGCEFGQPATLALPARLSECDLRSLFRY